MGRRAVSTTKSGKYMNPTDQARKEARKRELKKNKKQRLIVRTAVLKTKDPRELVAELEKVDQMQFDPNNPPPYSGTVLQNKYKKLKATWERVYQLYLKEEPAKAVEMKALEKEYDKHRSELMLYYESVKQAQDVQVDDIPLPSETVAMYPSMISAPPRSILKMPVSVTARLDAAKKKPPGPPPGLPPGLSDVEDNDDEDTGRPPRIRFSDEPSRHDNRQGLPMSNIIRAGTAAAQAAATRGPPRRPGMGMGMGPGLGPVPAAAQGAAVLSAPPSITRPRDERRQTATTIEAKPALRHLLKDATKLVPTTLLIKRGQSKTSSAPVHIPRLQPVQPKESTGGRAGADDAYVSFMREMQGFL